MTALDIATLCGWFADAAERARRAGFDAVEIHAGHGYVIASFLSPSTNHRDDAYGGPLENRARVLLEVIRAIRESARTTRGIAARAAILHAKSPQADPMLDTLSARLAGAAPASGDFALRRGNGCTARFSRSVETGVRLSSASVTRILFIQSILAEALGSEGSPRLR